MERCKLPWERGCQNIGKEEMREKTSCLEFLGQAQPFSNSQQ